MNICVVGTGYVGLVSGVCFSELGNHVTCVDVDEQKIAKLTEGKSPIYEPGIEDLIQKNLHKNRLLFTTDLKQAMESAQIVIIAVGTPRKQNGEADLTYIEKVAESIGQHLKSYKVIITKSTVPVGTGKIVKEIIRRHAGEVEFDVASNPEFLREGSAIYDTLNMERAVIGVESEKAAELLIGLHKPLTSNIVLTNIETAEMIKYASNAFLATKISFINEIANVCELLGADVTKVAEGMGYDKRIGHAFLQAGIGYGGSCFPKDTSALVAIAEKAGYDFRIVKDVEQVNKEQRSKVIDKLKVALKNELYGKRIAVLGLAFKPNTDDMRDAPSVDVIPILQNEGAEVVAYDPVANENAQKVIPNLEIADTMQEAIINSDAIMILTDWKEFKEIDLTEVSKLVKQKIIIDGRNIFSNEHMEQMGFYYASIGRKTVSFN
ncbi:MULTISPECIES: UDP-glucose dehydrogenase family protein [Metabacillus]|uniref:UDP-glucose 6-dehydrogenase n=3 Tax=Metabacillus TaxID=2675233 RepID=A0A179SVZ7_9BACI|nr:MULTISPECIES: UDP-glucose/GDP-mannose dehydrogenase family protein [Metabacillus]OAS85795.1 UDP-glucose 6-dehydrogenase [Metabacillus litoralis]QNF30864.1 UDP-glucose/GDP-mannose dehydrogenase family protein [Metabacillus sp. KUDC1714]